MAGYQPASSQGLFLPATGAVPRMAVQPLSSYVNSFSATDKVPRMVIQQLTKQQVSFGVLSEKGYDIHTC